MCVCVCVCVGEGSRRNSTIHISPVINFAADSATYTLYTFFLDCHTNMF